MKTRAYGSRGPQVVLLHGGPGAPGSMAPLGRALAASFRVFEPFQRRRADEPLSVASHVEDLDELLKSSCAGNKPALVGSSWGAMLALAYAAEHPRRVGPLVLIGCGTFDPAARRVTEATRAERMDDAFRNRLDQLSSEFPNPDERLHALGSLFSTLDSHELLTSDLEIEDCDERGHRETWEDMLRLQREGIYPAAFASIETPVLMLHGTVDPHPGRMIRASLEPYVREFEYREWEHCGHYPWLEKEARDEFFTVLSAWLAQQLTD